MSAIPWLRGLNENLLRVASALLGSALATVFIIIVGIAGCGRRIGKRQRVGAHG